MERYVFSFALLVSAALMAVGVAAAPAKTAAVRALPLRKVLVDGSKDIWSDCGKPGDHGKINSMHIVPDPPVPGKDVKVTGNVTLDENVTKGEVKVTATYNGSPVYTESMDLCETVQAAGMQCPLEKGILLFQYSYPFPAFAPKGDYGGKAVLSDQNGSEVSCVSLHFTV